MRKPFFIASIFWLLAATVHAETTEIEIEVIESDPDVVEQVENDDPHNSKTNSGEWNISLSLGYGQVESIISNVDDFDLYLLPNISYYGESFFLENTTMGYSLYEDEDFYLDIVGKLNEDGIYFNLDDFGVFSALGTSPPLRDPRIPPPPDIDRDISYLAGLALSYELAGLDLNAGYYQDITDVHNGYEVTLGLSKRFLLTDNWSLYLGANANHKSKKLLKYYYGITPEEGLLPAFTYQPNSSGNNYSFIVNSEYAFHDNWSWQLLIKRNLLSDEITDSLIVNTKHTDTYFFGIKYTL